MTKVTAAYQATKTWADNHGARSRPTVWGITGVKGEILALAGVFALMFGAPLFTMFVWVVHTRFAGSVMDFYMEAQTDGFAFLRTFYTLPSREAVFAVGIFGLTQAALQLYLPGKRVNGPVTPKGNTPVYTVERQNLNTANGVQSLLATLLLFVIGWWSNAFSPAQIYDMFGEILSALNIFSLTLCALLHIKGHLFPSSSDSGSTGSIVYDFYWGMELYPRIGKWFDIKTWTNCRMGMMSWAVLVLCYAAKQYEMHGYVADSMVISVTLMEIYVFKFFLWETGYWNSMDIAHDRAGYYLCWGCLNWVPGIYTSPALYLVKNPVRLGLPLAASIMTCGLLCIYINYDADRQRQSFRRLKGKLLIWGKPPRKINAVYETGNGQEKTSLLLASGWWGVARHFHYVPEILVSFFWTATGSFDNGLQYFYVIYLTLLLLDRAYRDDERCKVKYGDYWTAYCSLVPFMIIPGLF